MEFVLPTAHELHHGLRALKTVALADGELHPAERDVMGAAQRMFGHDGDLDALEPITPAELAAAVEAPATRFQLLGGLVVTTMADGDVNEAEAAAVAAFAAALGIEDSAVNNLRRLSKGHHRRARLDILRRQWAVRKIRAMAEEQGVGVYYRALLGMLRLRDDPETIARYRAWEAHPPGSLGRAYFDYLVENGFSFPGEKGAPPEAMLFHDLTHILSGYGTTPDQEILVAAFSAGYSSVEVLNWFVFVLSQFQLGLQTAPNVEPATMALDPARMLLAYRRGAAMRIDLNDGWDYWPVVGEPIEALRDRYNILPESHFEARAAR